MHQKALERLVLQAQQPLHGDFLEVDVTAGQEDLAGQHGHEIEGLDQLNGPSDAPRQGVTGFDVQHRRIGPNHVAENRAETVLFVENVVEGHPRLHPEVLTLIRVRVARGDIEVGEKGQHDALRLKHVVGAQDHSFRDDPDVPDPKTRVRRLDVEWVQDLVPLLKEDEGQIDTDLQEIGDAEGCDKVTRQLAAHEARHLLVVEVGQYEGIVGVIQEQSRIPLTTLEHQGRRLAEVARIEARRWIEPLRVEPSLGHCRRSDRARCQPNQNEHPYPPT